MIDYLEIFKKFKDVRDIADYIDEVEKLRYYCRTQQFQEMQKHIITLSNKYFVESALWNTVNQEKPTTYMQSYINAENFMQAQGAKIVVEKVADYKKHMSEEEIAFIESMIKPIE